MTLGFLSGSKNFCKLLCVSWEIFVLHGYDWIHWVAESCNKFTTFTKNFVICCNKVTKIFGTRYGSAIASSAWGPCDFGPLANLAISVFREVSINTVFTQNRTSRKLYRWFMRRTRVWVSAFRNSVIHKILSEFLQPFRYVGTQRRSTWVGKERVSPYALVILIFIWFLDFGWLSQQLLLRDFRRARVSPFLPFHTFTWHDCGMVLHPVWVSPFLSIHTRLTQLKMSWVVR